MTYYVFTWNETDRRLEIAGWAAEIFSVRNDRVHQE